MDDKLLINTLIIMAGIESKQPGAMPFEDNPLYVASERIKQLTEDRYNWQRKYEAAMDLAQHRSNSIDALMAQVEQLRDVLRYADNKLYILTHNRKDVSPRLLTDADKGYKAVHEAVLGFEDNLNVFVAKRDAEIKAQAERDAIGAFVDFVIDNDLSNALDAAAWRFDQLRQQAKAGE